MATEVASLTALLSLDDSGFVRGMRNASEQISGISGTFQNMGNSLKNLGGNLQSMGMQATMATAPIAAMGAVGIKAYGDFESVINEISARTGIVGDELQSISDYALEMGAATVFSGQQASEAFLDLLTSGQSAEEAFSTLPQVMSLAAAGGIELGQSADTLTDIMSMFGLAASDTVGNLSAAEYVANSLTQASQVSSASVSMLGDAFVNVGGIAAGFGLDVDTTNAALAVLAEGGLKGAEAGTNLKSMLLGMSATTSSTTEAWSRLGTSMYDSEGNMKNLNSLLGEIRTGLEDLPVSEQNEIIMGLAGSYGQLSLRTLLFGNDLAATQGAMEDAASATAVADQMMGSWNSQVGSLMGSLESLAISVMGPFVENTLKPLVAQAIEVVNSIKLWADENPELAQTIVKLAAAAVVIGPILLGIGTAVSIVGAALAGLGTIVGIVLSPIGLLVAAIAALGVAFVTDFGGIRTWFDANIRPWLVGLADAFTIGGWENAWTYIQGVFIKPLIAGFKSLVSGGQLQKTLEKLGSMFMDTVGTGIGNIMKWINVNLIKPLANAVGKYVGSGQLQKDLEKLGGMFMDAIRAGIGLVGQGLTWIYDNLIKPLGDAVSNYVTSGQLMDNLRSLGDMFMRAIGAGINLLGQGLTWVYENLIKPLGDAIFQYIDSGQLADTLVSLGTGFLDLIGKGITFVQGIPAWIYDNLIKPLFTSIGGETGSGGGLWESLMGFGSSILEGIGQGLNMLGGVATWIWDSVINPFITGMAEHVGLGEIWEKLKAFGGSILEGIGAGLTYIQNIGAWLYNTLIAPLIGGLTVEGGTTGDLWQSLLSLGGIFLDAVGAGLELIVSIGVWFRDTFIGPIIDAIGNFLGVGDLYDTLVDFGSGFLEWIADGIGNVSQWIHETIVKPMGDAINDILVSLGFLPDPRFMGYYRSPSSGGGGQSSRRYGGSVMANQPYMVGEVGPELFVPSASGTIIPNNELSSRVEIQQIVINAPSGDAREIASAFEIELSEIMRGRG